MTTRDGESRSMRLRRSIEEFGDPIYGLVGAPEHKYQGGGFDQSGRNLRLSYGVADDVVTVATSEGCREPWDESSLDLLLSHEHEVTFPRTITVEKSTVTWDVDGAPIEACVLHTPTRWVAGAHVGERFVEVRGSGVATERLRLCAITTVDVAVPSFDQRASEPTRPLGVATRPEEAAPRTHDREPMTARVRRAINELGDPIYGLAHAATHKWQGGGGGALWLGYRSGQSLVCVVTSERCVEPWEMTSLHWVLTSDSQLTFPWTLTVAKSFVTWDVDGVPIEARVLHTPTRWVAGAPVGERFVEVKAFGVPFGPMALRSLSIADVQVPWSEPPVP